MDAAHAEVCENKRDDLCVVLVGSISQGLEVSVDTVQGSLEGSQKAALCIIL